MSMARIEAVCKLEEWVADNVFFTIGNGKQFKMLDGYGIVENEATGA